MTCGIYSITNKDTGKMYIGQSIDIEKRFEHHIKYGKDCSYIDRSIKKHGKESFELNILCKCNKSKLDEEERKFILLFGTYTDGYNLTLGGDYKGIGNPNYSPEVIAKKSGENHHQFGKPLPKETADKISLTESKSKNKTGFFRVSKSIQDGYLKYSYMYYDNRKQKGFCSDNIFHLKKRVVENGLKWFIIDIDKAVNTIKESEDYSKNKSDNRNTTGFYKVSKNKDETCKQGYYFQYSYIQDDSKKTFSSTDISELERKVKKNGLRWGIVNKEFADKTLTQNKKDIENTKLKPHGNAGKSIPTYKETNSTGFYRTQLVLNKEMKIGYYFVYIYKFKGAYKRIYSKDIKKLEKRVKDANLEWRILDNKKAQHTILKNREDLEKEKKGRVNASGLYNVFISKRKNGFTYTYRYTLNKKRTNISSHSISDLKNKVLSKGLDWIVLDEQKAMENGLL